MIKTLTGIRGYSVIAVLLFHLVGLHLCCPDVDLGYDVGVGLYVNWGAWGNWTKFGWYGVDIFFILSGFVISYNYEEMFHDIIKLKNITLFISLRLIRIYPAYLISLISLIFLSQVGIMSGDIANPSALLYHFTLTYVWWFYPRYGETWNLPAWSLSCEFFSYLLFPFIARYLNRKSQGIYFYCFIILFCALLLDLVGVHPVDAQGYALLRAGLNFFIGYITFLIYSLSIPRKEWEVITLAAIFLLVFVNIFSDNIVIVSSTLCTTLLILGLALSDGVVSKYSISKRVFSNKLILFMGTISYSIYIIHYPCFLFLGWIINYYGDYLVPYMHDQMIVSLILFLIIFFVILTGYALYYFIERPIISCFKKRIFVAN